VHSNIHESDVSNIDWNGFKDYVFKKYAESWGRTVYSYARKYVGLIDNPSMVETFSGSKKNAVLKSLVAFSKYYGFYQEFKKKIKDYGIKWSRSSSVDAFFRIMSNSNSDVLSWYKEALKILDGSQLSTYLKFVITSGLRKTEAINAFNLLTELTNNGKINEYYNKELKTLEHFKYPKLFFRNTKNVFISMIPQKMIMQIAQSDPVTYEMIRKRLHRKGLGVKISGLRDFYATFMVRHGLIKEEVDLLQGRIGKSIFVRHYWSPAIKELKQRVFKALQELKRTALS